MGAGTVVGPDLDRCRPLPGLLPDLEAAEHNAAALAKAIVEQAASTGGDTRMPRSIEITDAAGEELLYLVFWAGPKVGDTGEEISTVPPTTVH